MEDTKGNCKVDNDRKNYFNYEWDYCSSSDDMTWNSDSIKNYDQVSIPCLFLSNEMSYH